MMSIGDDVENCFKFIREGGWTWFVTLRHRTHFKDGRTTLNLHDAFGEWIGWMDQNFGNGQIDYVVATEPCQDGTSLLHVLLRDVPEKSRWVWRYQWYGLGGGGAWDRRLEKAEGFFKFFYYKRGFKIVSVWKGSESEYQFSRKSDKQ